MKLQTKYVILKATTIFFGALSIPWSTFTGFCFGDGRYLTGLISLAVQTVVALVDGYIWFWVLENMKDKIQSDVLPSGFHNSRIGFTADQESRRQDLRSDRVDLKKSAEQPR